ncbi:hypothetical protein CRE_24584 [Caenorhabditis remanei]|uniref:R3H-associated N-terminal domain-containing protein n=1 Tax=Caenorhabditis remanei TaxID=31234 RepID=E3MVA8_CAERE|nr:hypothetical protein CRE_24584 [Caenorhabditis remanei]
MGVPRKEPAEFRPIRVEDTDEYNNYANYDLAESADEMNDLARRISVEQLHPIRNKNAKKMKMAQKPRRFDEIDTDGVNVKRNMGMRKWRRVEHARIMLTFTDLEDICEDGSDIASQPTTAFDKLFADKENMKLWNEFCSRDEVEQRRILNGTSSLQKPSVVDTPTTSKGTPATSCSGKSPTKKPAKRFSPYSGAACFDRIDYKSRMALLGRKVNWAFVDFLEKELRNVFRIDARNQQDTEAVFIGHYPASSDRLLAHIVAQWLGLSSQSITDPSLKERITEIRNRRPLIPPQTTLIAHLEGRVLKRDIDFVPFSMRDEKQEVEGENEADEEQKDSDPDMSFLVDELDELNISSDSGSEESWEKISKPAEDPDA